MRRYGVMEMKHFNDVLVYFEFSVCVQSPMRCVCCCCVLLVYVLNVCRLGYRYTQMKKTAAQWNIRFTDLTNTCGINAILPFVSLPFCAVFPAGLFF